MNSLLRVCPWHDHVLIMKTTITFLSFSFFLFLFFFEMGTLLIVMPLLGADLVVQDDGIEFVRCWWRARGIHWKRVENFQYCSSFTKLESRQDVVLLSKMIKDRLARGKFVSPTT